MLTEELELSYQTVWHLLHKLRSAMAEPDFRYVLAGVVELDDAYFSGGLGRGCRRDALPSGRGTTKTKVVIGLATADKKPLYVKK